MVDLFNTVNDIMFVVGGVFTVTAVTLGVAALWNWALFIPAAIYAWAAYEFFDAGRWMSQSESKWHQLIGAGGFFTQRRFVKGGLTSICQDRLNQAFSMYYSGNISNYILELIRYMVWVDPACYNNDVLDVSVPVNNQSDGLFNAGTQQMINDPFDATHVVNRPVIGVNHREFFNHPSMTQEFLDIFSGNTQANTFFITR